MACQVLGGRGDGECLLTWEVTMRINVVNAPGQPPPSPPPPPPPGPIPVPPPPGGGGSPLWQSGARPSGRAPTP